MRVRFFYLAITLLLSTGVVVAQPVIQKIEPHASFPKTRILISGSGFSSTPSQLQVWFDQVRGDIIASSEFSIEVEVPAQARLNSITVVNLSTRLSTQSGAKYMPVYNGEGFDPAKLDAPVSIPSSPNRIFDLITLDVDGDKKPDIIGSRDENTATSLALLMNNSTIGNISFTNTVIPSFTLNAPTRHLAVGDLNGDGKPDIATSRSGATSSSIFVLGNTSTAGNPSFVAAPTLNMETLQIAREVEIEDLNGDGKPEIIVANEASNELYIYRNESSGGTITINPTPIKITVTGANKLYGIQTQDLDGDLKPDIAITQLQGNDIYILKNVSTTSTFNFTISKITIARRYNDITTADFNKDGKVDLVATSLFDNDVSVFLNQSTNTAIAFTPFPIPVSTDSEPFGIDVSDLNGDGFPDFIVGSRGANTLNVFIHNKNVTTVGFTKVVINTAKTNWYVRAGDLDGDAKPDIAFTSFQGTSFSVDILRNKNCHIPKILNEGTLTLCSSQTIRLLAIPIPGITYEWSNGFNVVKSSTDPFLDATVAATYTVTAKSESGACSIASAPITINSGAGIVPTDPTINGSSPICLGSTLTLSTTLVSGATYTWKGPNNFTSSLPNISIPGATIANAGIYSLSVKVGDCSSNTVTKQVDILSLGSFSISSSSANNTVCQGQSVTLTVNSQPGYTYQWLKNNTPISGQTSATLNVIEEGSYKVKVDNTSLSCSQETNAISVVIYLLPSAAFTIPATACVGNTISFTNSSTVDTRVTSVIHSWEFGDNATSTLKDPTHVYSTAQTFNPKLTVSYSGVTGCTSTITKNIVIGNVSNPTILATKEAICPEGGETSTLSVSGTFDTYKWSNGATTPTIDITAPGNYSVEITAPGGCAGSSSITILEKAVADCETLPPPEPIFPMVFTPNGDSQNDRWVIPGIENKGDCTMNIFDGRGRKIYEVKGYPVEGWDGNYDGKEVPAGTYYYVLSCPDLPPTTGSVLVVR